MGLVMWIRTSEGREIKDLDDIVVFVKEVVIDSKSGARAIHAVKIAFIFGQFSVHQS
jgi:hypothetical protein